MTKRTEMIARKNGRLAYAIGERSDANPYEHGTPPYRAWRAGWTDMALLDAATCGTDGEKLIAGIKAADAAEPEATFNNVEDMLKWLDTPNSKE